MGQKNGLVSWPDNPEPVFFSSGEDMWNYYGNNQHYNPMENLSLGANTSINDLIRNRTFDRTNKYNYLIPQARDLLMRIRIEDLFWNDCDDIVFSNLNDDFETIKKHHPEIPDLDELWCGSLSEQMEPIIRKFIQLLDPLTMAWVKPERIMLKDDRYIRTCHPKVAECDPTFLYDEQIGHDEWLRDDILETIRNHNVPNTVWDILNKYEDLIQ